jgi:hypothetical protein
MATTTTNFGWDIPQSTDLVKDGATAIAALGQDIDTAFVDFKGGTTGQVLKKTSGTDLDVEWGTASSGLTLINTTSFSGVSSQSLNSIFSATYDNYKILFQGTISSSAELNWRGRTAGSDNTNSDYSLRTFGFGRDATSGLTASNSVSSGRIGTIAATSNKADITIFDPFASRSTSLISFFNNGSGDDFGYFQYVGSFFDQNTSFDGITIFPASGTITGTVSVYGYSK